MALISHHNNQNIIRIGRFVTFGQYLFISPLKLHPSITLEPHTLLPTALSCITTDPFLFVLLPCSGKFPRRFHGTRVVRLPGLCFISVSTIMLPVFAIVRLRAVSFSSLVR